MRRAELYRGIRVYLESGPKRAFASAPQWPGWCRSGPDDSGASEALLEHGARYQRVLGRTGLGFTAPTSIAWLNVVEGLVGNATTDFGAPGVAPSADSAPMDPTEPEGTSRDPKACWRAFDAAVRSAGGRELRKGPRGAGRKLEAIARNVLDAERFYLRQLGCRFPGGGPQGGPERTRRAVREGRQAAARGGLQRRGPRGGAGWTPRHFVRRSGWQMLGHHWEIEDRL